MLVAAVMPNATETAVANGDTRTLTLFHNNTKESIQATFRVNGHYDQAVLDQLNWFCRDWRRDEPTKMDPRLFDVVWEAYRAAGATEPVTVYSAYRSPSTNAMLRRRSRAVAEHSQHMLGKAMDTTMPGMSMEKIREIGMRMQRGGVGYYQNANFVHLDVGSVRSWPRMGYDQLARLFPDGKTVHIASNGQVLARYEEARAEIAANGGISDTPPSQQSKGFFAWLFGGGSQAGGDDEEEMAVASPAPKRGRGATVVAGRNRGAAPVAVAQNEVGTGGEDGGRNIFVADSSRRARNAPASAPAPAPPPPPAPTPVAQTPPAAPPPAAPDPAAVAAQKAALDSLLASVEKPRLSREPVAEIAALTVLPPRRPSELVVALADIPTPPTRPLLRGGISLASASATDSMPVAKIPDAIGTLIAKSPTSSAPSASAPQSLPPGALPAVITQGSRERRPPSGVPNQVMAYAPPAQIQGLQGLRSAAQTKTAHAAVAPKPDVPAMTPARLDQSNFRSMTAGIATADMPTQSVLGPTVTGLRAAARVAPGTLTASASAVYATRFTQVASDLPSDRFAPAPASAALARSGDVQIIAGAVLRRSP